MAGTKRRRTSAAAGAQPAEPTQPEPAHSERPPAGDSFLITAGTYERILYGIEARFAGSQLVLSPQFIFPSHIGCIKAVAAGGRYLASGSTDEIVKVYDLKKRVELGSLHEHKGSITALQFHGHTHLLSASEDGAICVFRTKDWEPLKVLRGHRSPVSSIAIHPTGKLALSVSRDRTIIIWNLLTGQRASRTKTPQVGELVAWSPSGAHYVVAYATEMQVHAVSQAEALSTIFARQRILAVLVVAHEGTEYVLCGCQDKRIHVYSTAGAELASFHCHDNRVKDLGSVDMVFPDGTTHTVVVSISSDGRIKAWDLAAMLGSIRASPTPDQPDDSTPALQIEPLAVYNADARLTCVSVSNNAF